MVIAEEPTDTKSQLELVEKSILEKNIPLLKKDAFSLSHVNMVLFLKEKEGIEEIKTMWQSVIDNQKAKAYTQWINKQKENTIVDDLELKLANEFIQSYITKFKIK